MGGYSKQCATALFFQIVGVNILFSNEGFENIQFDVSEKQLTEGIKKYQFSSQLDKLLLCALLSTGNNFTKNSRIFCLNQNLQMRVPILHIKAPKQLSQEALVMFYFLLLKSSFCKWFL